MTVSLTTQNAYIRYRLAQDTSSEKRGQNTSSPKSVSLGGAAQPDTYGPSYQLEKTLTDRMAAQQKTSEMYEGYKITGKDAGSNGNESQGETLPITKVSSDPKQFGKLSGQLRYTGESDLIYEKIEFPKTYDIRELFYSIDRDLGIWYDAFTGKM